jgi:hypothetical protein
MNHGFVRKVKKVEVKVQSFFEDYKHYSFFAKLKTQSIHICFGQQIDT